VPKTSGIWSSLQSRNGEPEPEAGRMCVRLIEREGDTRGVRGRDAAAGVRDVVHERRAQRSALEHVRRLEYRPQRHSARVCEVDCVGEQRAEAVPEQVLVRAEEMDVERERVLARNAHGYAALDGGHGGRARARRSHTRAQPPAARCELAGAASAREARHCGRGVHLRTPFARTRTRQPRDPLRV
jgi:hypothetical protein